MSRKRLELDFNKKYGRLTLLTRMDNRYTTYRCRCDCGNEVKVQARNLKSGATKSCGCLKKEVNSKTGKATKGCARNKTHDMTNTPEHNAWRNMKARCSNPNYKYYEHYGGRGITICDHWLESFENFLEDMGEKPFPKFLYSIDRINNDGNYELDNCRWATKKQQANNRRNSKT